MSVGVVNKQTGDRIPTAGMPAIDSVLSGSSTNPVQNAVITAALDEKADTDIVASDFDATASYTAGNYCIYEGKFYKFNNNHSGAWAAADVDEIQIAGELSSIKSGLTNVSNKLPASCRMFSEFGTTLVIPNPYLAVALIASTYGVGGKAGFYTYTANPGTLQTILASGAQITASYSTVDQTITFTSDRNVAWVAICG